MTIMLNPFQDRPVPPSATQPSLTQGGNPAPNSGFGDLLRALSPQRSSPAEFLKGDDSLEAKGPRTQAAAAADIFNEHGLFQGAVSGLAPVNWHGSEAPQAPVGQITSTVGCAAASAQGQSMPADAKMTVPAERDSPVPGFVSGQPAGHSGALSKLASNPTGQPLIVSAQARENPVSAGAAFSTRAARAPSRLAGLLLRVRAQELAALNSSVSVQAVEQELHVGARLEGLEREARGRLRDRIAALLSRHGLIGHSIIVNGDSCAPSRPHDGGR